jgi:phosphoserine phosphatase
LHLVLMDLDGTLLRGWSAEKRFGLHLLLAGMIGPRQIQAAAVCLHRLHRSGATSAWKKNKAYLAGRRVVDIERRAAEYVDRSILPRVEPMMRCRLEDHREKGDLTMLLTGTLSCLAFPLARRLGLHGCLATQCHTDAGRYTAAPPTQHPLGVEKLQLASALCRRTAARLTNCTAYADAAEDIPLMASVSNPVAVNPDPVLARQAVRCGWQILEWPAKTAAYRGRDTGRPLCPSGRTRSSPKECATRHL